MKTIPLRKVQSGIVKRLRLHIKTMRRGCSKDKALKRTFDAYLHGVSVAIATVNAQFESYR